MSTKYILVGGYVNKASDGGKAFYDELVKGFDKKPVKILDCMFARYEKDWPETFAKDQELFSKYIKDFELKLASVENFIEEVKESDVIFLRGGYTTMLMDFLNKDKSWINYLDGKVVAGTSAGGEVIAKYYHILKSNKKGDGFGFVPIKFIPHWKSDFFDGEKQNLDYDKILEELKDYKEDVEIIVLKEGEFKVFEK